jgi:hypothetical protein
MKIRLGRELIAVGAAVMMTACASIGPPQPPSLELPKPPLDLRAVRKGDRVTLTWTIPTATTDRQTVRSVGATRICRGVQAKLMECGTAVGEAAPGVVPNQSPKQKISGTYTDLLPAEMENEDPASQATYAVEVLNANGRGAGLSNQVRVALVRTLPPPRDFDARVTGQGVVLSWTNELPAADSAVHSVYRVYRRPLGGTEQTVVGEVPAGERNATLTDSSFEWEKTYEYRAEVVTVIGAQEVEGDDTPEVKVFADDVFPPAVPSGLQAVFSGPGQQAFIDLIWAPASDVDLDGYNVYRREEGGAAEKVNADAVKSPAYRDTRVVAGKRYFYTVTAVDVRGNESARSEEAEESVP